MLKQPLPVVQASSDQADIGETVLVTAWVSSEQANMAQVALGYALRFGQEHSYRFDKQALLREQPRLHTPEQKAMGPLALVGQLLNPVSSTTAVYLCNLSAHH